MVGIEKWSQVDIDTVFSLKYGQGWSEPMITDYVASHCLNHRNVKVAGIRYVLRSKRPSAGTPDSPTRSQKMQKMSSQAQPNSSNFQVQQPQKEFVQYQQQQMDLQGSNQQDFLTQQRLQQQFASQINMLPMSTQEIEYHRKQNQLSLQAIAQTPLVPIQNSLQQMPMMSHQTIRPFYERGFNRENYCEEQQFQIPEIGRINPAENFSWNTEGAETCHKALTACNERFQKAVDRLEANCKNFNDCIQLEIDDIIRGEPKLKSPGQTFDSIKKVRLENLEIKRKTFLEKKKRERLNLEMTHNQEIAALMAKFETRQGVWDQSQQTIHQDNPVITWEKNFQEQVHLAPGQNSQSRQISNHEQWCSPFVNESPELSQCLPMPMTQTSDIKAQEIPKISGLKDQHVDNSLSSSEMHIEDQIVPSQSENHSIFPIANRYKSQDLDLFTSTYFSDSFPCFGSTFPVSDDCGSDFASQNNFEGINAATKQQMQGDTCNTLNNVESQHSFDGSSVFGDKGDEGDYLSQHSGPSTQTSHSQSISLHQNFSSPPCTDNIDCTYDEISGTTESNKAKLISKSTSKHRVEKKIPFWAGIKKQKRDKTCKITHVAEGNRFGGIKGPPVAGITATVDNYESYIDPLCNARLYEDNFSEINSQNLTRSTQQNNINIPNLSDNYCTLSNMPNSDSSAKEVKSPPLNAITSSALDTVTINLNNPEFNGTFDLPLDTHNWTVGRTKAIDFTLHSNTPESQVTINMINPKFYAGFRVRGIFVSPKCSQELLEVLKDEGDLTQGAEKIKNLMQTEPERYCDPDSAIDIESQKMTEPVSCSNQSEKLIGGEM